jgi:hypothetical protein
LIRLALIALAWLTLPAQSACRQALLLGIDVSGSVDAREYRQQMRGLAGALLSPEVSQTFLLSPQAPVSLAVYEWSATTYQRIVQPWRTITSIADLEAVALRLRSETRRAGRGATAIGVSMDYAAWMFANGPECWKRTLDLSGDGKNNDGPFPEHVRLRPEFSDVTINGLVIGSDVSRGRDERQMEVMELSAYFRRRVIHGPGAFIEVALGFADYQRAMERKLLRELEGLVIGGLSPALHSAGN